MIVGPTSRALHVEDAVRRLAVSDHLQGDSSRQRAANWINVRIHRHVDSHPNSSLYRADFRQRHRAYWGSGPDAIDVSHDSRLAPGAVRTAVRGFVALERSVRSCLLGMTAYVLEGDFGDAWNLGEACTRDFGPSGLGGAASTWQGVVAKESGDLCLAMERFELGASSEVGPIACSSLWSWLLTAIELEDLEAMGRASARLAERDQARVADSRSCILATIERRLPTKKFRDLRECLDRVCQDRLPSGMST